MKPETAAALRNLDRRQRVELVAFMADLMSAEEFVEALEHKPGDARDTVLTKDGELITNHLLESYFDHLVDVETPEVDQLHEAICEGRQQDAVDLLTAITGFDFRSVSTQNRLFPHRVETPLFNF